MNQENGHGDLKAKQTNDATSPSDQTNNDVTSGVKQGGISFGVRKLLEAIFS